MSQLAPAEKYARVTSTCMMLNLESGSALLNKFFNNSIGGVAAKSSGPLYVLVVFATSLERNNPSAFLKPTKRTTSNWCPKSRASCVGTRHHVVNVHWLEELDFRRVLSAPPSRQVVRP